MVTAGCNTCGRTRSLAPTVGNDVGRDAAAGSPQDVILVAEHNASKTTLASVVGIDVGDDAAK